MAARRERDHHLNGFERNRNRNRNRNATVTMRKPPTQGHHKVMGSHPKPHGSEPPVRRRLMSRSLGSNLQPQHFYRLQSHAAELNLPAEADSAEEHV
ncbi:hypothetical protein SKAU_G00408670 [Synaphobranchus kaupii]|uniref:Uncharacterized protein n=1 Tax=Synaphobranchus kaupii TaxID=118154 RepID=A0A9Q1EAG9_SYNKA|nr:hypothetical protein SKAU_G00408670 [Synaphobranchus kaupii]